MQTKSIANVVLMSNFGKYASTEGLFQETVGDLVTRLQETSQSVITINNLRLNGKIIDKSDKISDLFRRASRYNVNPKVSNKKLCRLCANRSKTLVDIISPNTDYSEMMRSCLSIEVNENDLLPTKICKLCVGILSEFYKFKQKTTEAELKLKSYFKCSDSLTSFNNPSVILDSNELFQISEMDCDVSENFHDYNFDVSSDNVFENSVNTLRLDDIDDTDFSENEEKPLPCKWCNKSFDSVIELYNHSLSHSENNQNFQKKNISKRPAKRKGLILRKQTCYLCTACDQVFPIKQFFLQHCKADHHTLERKISPGSVVHLSRVYSCSYCDAKYIGMKQLTSHIQTCLHHFTTHDDVHNDRGKLWCIPLMRAMKRICDFCKNKFTSSKALMRHKTGTDVLGIKTLSCSECSKTFSSECALKWHAKNHNAPKEYICEVCGKDFCKLASLLNHRMGHSSEKVFICGTCKKGFRTKDSLKIHDRVHTGVRPYSCSECDARFKSSGALSKHKKTHGKILCKME